MTNEALREVIAPGTKCSDLYRRGVGMMKRQGLRLLNQFLGHSTAREHVHTYPCLMESYDTVLEPGMVVIVEPVVRVTGIGSINIEGMVVVTEDGREDITTLSRRPASDVGTGLS